MSSESTHAAADRAKFDAYASDYASVHAKNVALSGEDPEYFAVYKLRCLQRLVGPSFDEPVLDYGCGVGMVTGHLATRFSQVEGFDPSAESLAEARARVPAARFHDTLDTLPDDRFGLVVMSGVLHHIHPTERAEVLRRAIAQAATRDGPPRRLRAQPPEPAHAPRRLDLPLRRRRDHALALGGAAPARERGPAPGGPSIHRLPAARAGTPAVVGAAPGRRAARRPDDARRRAPLRAGSAMTTTATTQPVLLNDFKRQWEETGPAVLAAVAQVGESGWYILGQSVERFEAAFARAVSRRFSIGCASGLDAIEIAAARPGPARGRARVLHDAAERVRDHAGDRVRREASPVFVDVDARGNLDLALCERLLAARSDVTYAVPVHLYGCPLELSHLARLQERFGLRVVEDCAQAVAASSSGRGVGTVGALAAYSFYPTKNLGALGDAGAVATDDEGLAEACRSLRNYGQSTRYVHDRLGLNSRLDELHAAILASAFLPRLAAWTARRRAVAARYLAKISHAQVRPLLGGDAGAVWHLFPVQVPAASRQDFRDHLQRAGVQSAVHYPGLIPDQEALRAAPFEVATELTRAREIADGEVSLPIHPHLSDDDVERVIAAVNGWTAP